jgi:hypothetical protein
MRRMTLSLLALALTVAALVGAAPKVEAQQEICPLCIIGDHCCFFGPHARCIPESKPCP